MKVGDMVKVRKGAHKGDQGKIVAEVLTDVKVSYPDERVEICSKIDIIVQFDGYWKAMNRLSLEQINESRL